MLPGPTNVPDRVMNAMLTPIINHRSDDFRRLYKTIVEKTQRVFQTQNDIVLLTTSGTGAVEASVINMIRKNDKAIIPVNGEFGTRLADLIDSWGGHAIRVTAPFGQNPQYSEIEDAFDRNKDIKAIYAVYNETSTGTTLRYMDKLSQLCSERGAFFIADAVSILGGDELPVDKWNVDICVTASQKALAAPPGVSPMSISARAKKHMQANPPPTQYLNLKRYFRYSKKILKRHSLLRYHCSMPSVKHSTWFLRKDWTKELHVTKPAQMRFTQVWMRWAYHLLRGKMLGAM